MIAKKGTSNIEIILSFIIFIGFVFFLFLIFPISRTEKSQVGLDAAERGIKNYTSSEVLYFSAVFNESEIREIVKTSNNWNCLHFRLNFEVSKIIVKNEEQSFVNASSELDNIYINEIGRFYQIYSSPEFEERGFKHDGCSEEINKSYFDLGTIRKYSVLSYSKLKELNSSYFSDYSGLHLAFNIPKRDNFGFILRETKGNVIINALRSGGDKSDVLSRDIPVQIAHSNGTLDYAILNIRVW